MKLVLFAGGFGTRLSEESQYKLKPMVDIGGDNAAKFFREKKMTDGVD